MRPEARVQTDDREVVETCDDLIRCAESLLGVVRSASEACGNTYQFRDYRIARRAGAVAAGGQVTGRGSGLILKANSVCPNRRDDDGRSVGQTVGQW